MSGICSLSSLFYYIAISRIKDNILNCVILLILSIPYQINGQDQPMQGVVGWCEGAVYLTSLGRPTDIGLQLGKACYPCSG